MSTVLLSYCYPPLRYPRSIQVSHLARHSALKAVSVVAADEGPGDDELLSVIPDGVPTTRLAWNARARFARGLRARTLKDRMLVPDHFRPWSHEAARHLIRARELGPADTLVSFGQPMSDHLAALSVARRTGVRWLAHFSDPWARSPFRSGNSVAAALNARQERRVIKEADRVIFTSEETVDLVMAPYDDRDRRKATVLPHAFDDSLYPTGEPAGNDSTIVRYVGNFYGRRSPEPLFAALATMAHTRPDALEGVRVELIGSSEFDPLSVPSAAKLPAGLVEIRAAVPYLESLSLMRSADLLLIVDAPAERSVFLPSKLIEYLGARRPVVALTPPGPAAELTHEIGGWQADPADPAAAAEALTAGLSVARAASAADWGDEHSRRRFAAIEVAGRFDALVRGEA